MDEIDKILQALQDLDKESLKNTLAYLIKVYILDRKSPNASAAVAGEPRQGLELPANAQTFTDLMTEIKRSYRMDELKKFSIEGGKVYITLDNKRYQLSSDEVEKPRTEMRKPEIKSANNIGRYRNIEMDD